MKFFVSVSYCALTVGLSLCAQALPAHAGSPNTMYVEASPYGYNPNEPRRPGMIEQDIRTRQVSPNDLAFPPSPQAARAAADALHQGYRKEVPVDQRQAIVPQQQMQQAPRVNYAPQPQAQTQPQPQQPRYVLQSGAQPSAPDQQRQVRHQPPAPEPYNQPNFVARPMQQAALAPVLQAPHPIARSKFQRQEVDYETTEKAGAIVVDTPNHFLYLVLGSGRALRYGIGVGRPGFEWAGMKEITRKAEWPAWIPPQEMLLRRPDLPKRMEGGPDNPLGARALYLGSSLYRIHGTNEPSTIGLNLSSGCIRMMNEDVTDLYERVGVGTRVVVI